MGRSSIRAKASRLTTTTAATPTNSKPVTKKSLRIAKHSAFVSRIEKTSSKAPSSSSRSRRRKAANSTLATSLSTLADALPSASSDDFVNANVNFVSQSSRDHLAARSNKERQGIKSRPGAMKRKENMLKNECERFGKNLAIIEGVRSQEGAGEGERKKEGQPNSWAMLRNFIGSTMEKKEEFVEREKKAAAAMEVDI
ncbi:hypothetical protein EX30DRAFT_339578 [Ascodesmis nigricans]|uniref:Ribosome biogenesis protein SLX9 n=1 Tax=Ascodesmis nigricans TaxID=341454 RepID=A0A4S2N2N7_9PEZI|nr:hypothetical protein EX30DRAFT_339578 [Ascodesmis nigricans]